MNRSNMRKLAGRNPVGKVYKLDLPDEPKRQGSGVAPKKPDSLSTDTLFAMGEIQGTIKQMMKFARTKNLHLARKEMGRAAGQLGFIAKSNGWDMEGTLLLKVGKSMMKG